MNFRIGSYIVWIGKKPLSIEEEKIAAILLQKRIRILKEKEILQVEILRLKAEKYDREP